MPRVFGYSGNATRVAFFWDPGGYEGFSHDGRILTNAIDRVAFAEYLRHPRVARVLKEYPLIPNEEEKSTHFWLVLEIKERKLFIAPPDAALAFLREQYPLSPASLPVVMSPEELTRLANQALQRMHNEHQETQYLSLVDIQTNQILQDEEHKDFFQWLEML